MAEACSRGGGASGLRLAQAWPDVRRQSVRRLGCRTLAGARGGERCRAKGDRSCRVLAGPCGARCHRRAVVHWLAAGLRASQDFVPGSAGGRIRGSRGDLCRRAIGRAGAAAGRPPPVVVVICPPPPPLWWTGAAAWAPGRSTSTTACPWRRLWRCRRLRAWPPGSASIGAKSKSGGSPRRAAGRRPH